MTSDNTSPHAQKTGAPASEATAPAAHREPNRKVERRTVLAALGIGAAGLGLVGAASPSQASAVRSARAKTAAGTQPACVLAPEVTAGPYYIDEELIRRNIAEDCEGLPLETRIIVVHGTECTPIPGAEVEVWMCDAGGYYSGHLDVSPDVPPKGSEHLEPTDSSRFQRGMQIADRRGEVRFRSIYPGWYYGRAVHIHITVHVDGLEVHTGQLYFPEEINKKVALMEPYVRHTGTRRIPNEEDIGYLNYGGEKSTLDVRPFRPHRPELGYLASITTGVIPGQTPPEPTFPPSA
ncbi:hypothetical protein [Streptomyces sp. NPDC046909]|uniref:intradiol ring-cleavage dioxygenase n=1 Tax=Streptomyces sp. NPDC046909 TaxID=3155617 RepID=UPI00340AC444